MNEFAAACTQELLGRYLENDLRFERNVAYVLDRYISKVDAGANICASIFLYDAMRPWDASTRWGEQSNDGLAHFWATYRSGSLLSTPKRADVGAAREDSGTPLSGRSVGLQETEPDPHAVQISADQADERTVDLRRLSAETTSPIYLAATEKRSYFYDKRPQLPHAALCFHAKCEYSFPAIFDERCWAIIDVQSDRLASLVPAIQEMVTQASGILARHLAHTTDRQRCKYYSIIQRALEDETSAAHRQAEEVPSSIISALAAISRGTKKPGRVVADYVPYHKSKRELDFTRAQSSDISSIEKLKAISSEPIAPDQDDFFQYVISAAAYLRRPVFLHDLAEPEPGLPPEAQSSVDAVSLENKSSRFFIKYKALGRSTLSEYAVPILSSIILDPSKADLIGILNIEHPAVYQFGSAEMEAVTAYGRILAISDADARLNQLNRFLAPGFASASLMARNMSHHMGSHVLHYLIPLISAIGDNTTKLAGECAISHPELFEIGIQDVQATILLQRLLRYLRGRVLFIAIQSSPIGPKQNVPFLEHLREFTDNPLIVTNLVRAPLGGGDQDSNPRSSINSSLVEIRVLIDGRAREEPRNKIVVSIPQGRLGMQALYAILENVIRNAANYCPKEMKASIAKGESSLRLVISIESSWSDGRYISRSADYFRIKIQDNCPKEQVVEDRLREVMSRPFSNLINTKGGIAGALGLTEIKLCAGYLRGVPPVRLDDAMSEFQKSGSPEPPILEATLDPYGEGSERTLCYTLYVHKPKTLLIVTDRPDQFGVLPEGVDIRSKHEFVRTLKEGTAYRHSFAWLASDFTKSEFHDVIGQRHFLPFRLLLGDANAVILREAYTSDTGKAFEEGWLRHRIAILSDEFAAFLRSYLENGPSPRGLAALLYGAFSGPWDPRECVLVKWDHASDLQLDARILVSPDQNRSMHVGGKQGSRDYFVYDHFQFANLDPSKDAVFSGSVFYESISEGSTTRTLLDEAVGQLVSDVAVNHERSNVLGILPEALGDIYSLLEASRSVIYLYDNRFVDILDTVPKDKGAEKFSNSVTVKQGWAKRRVFLDGEHELQREFDLWDGEPASIRSSFAFFAGNCTILSLHQQVLKTLRTVVEATAEAEAKRRQEEKLRTFWSEVRDRIPLYIIHTSVGDLDSDMLEFVGDSSCPWLSHSDVADPVLVGTKFDVFSALVTAQGKHRERKDIERQ